VVIDRYAYSGAAFTAAKGLDLEWCKNPDRGLPQPDLILYLSLPITEAGKRGGFGGERYEKTEFQEKVKLIFDTLKNQEKTGQEWVVINALQEPDNITKQILDLVMAKIKEPNKKPIANSLWL